MKRLRFLVSAVALTACAAPAVRPLVPSQRTIARVESGYALLEDLSMVGVADAASMNAASRVKVRNVRCNPVASQAATCSYEANRCLNVEADVDGDGWCARTTRFLRAGQARGIGNVVVAGWGLESAIRSDFLADPGVAELIRLRSIVCLDFSAECLAQQTQIADNLAARDLSFVKVATDDAGADYSLLQRDLRSRASDMPHVWIFRDDPGSAASLLWQIDCEARTHVELGEVLRDKHGTSYRWGSEASPLARPDLPADQLVAAVCKAPIIRGYSHL